MHCLISPRLPQEPQRPAHIARPAAGAQRRRIARHAGLLEPPQALHGLIRPAADGVGAQQAAVAPLSGQQAQLPHVVLRPGHAGGLGGGVHEDVQLDDLKQGR